MVAVTPQDWPIPVDSDALAVRIDFHGPFRVGTGRPGTGVTEVVDLDDPLPASSLKGLMRASATHLLPHSTALINQVFGTGRQPSAWYWDDATFLEQLTPHTRARVRVDNDTGVVAANHLFLAEELWPAQAFFTVTPAEPLTEEEHQNHRTVLACAAAGVHGLGADRRRGYGWVTCVPLQPTVDDALLARFEEFRAEGEEEAARA